MADYEVMVQNTEGNEENLSITGVVNGRQVAAVVRQILKPKKGGKKALDDFYAGALVDAYLAMPPKEPSAAAITVRRE